MRPVRRVGLLGLGAASLCLLGLGTALLLSALFHYQANRFLDDWQRSGTQPSDRAWNVAASAANRAITWYPGDDAALWNTQGRIQEWKQYTLPMGAPEAEDSRRAALTAYRRATTLRPTWPYSWGDLALIKARLGEVDAEMVNALQQALNNGPYRSTVLQRVAQVGLLSWFSLPAPGQAVTLQAIENGMNLDHRTARAIWSSVETFQRQAAVCGELGERVTWLEGHCP